MRGTGGNAQTVEEWASGSTGFTSTATAFAGNLTRAPRQTARRDPAASTSRFTDSLFVFGFPLTGESRLARLVRHFAGIYEPAQHREACNARGGGDQISNVNCYEFSVR